MAKKKLDHVNTNVEKEKTKKTDPKNVTFFQMFKYSTKLDKFLIFIGVLCSILTGILQPLNTILFGNLAGKAIDYAQNLIFEEDFLDSIAFFSKTNALVGASMLLLSYISTITFNYTAIKQLFKIKAEYLKSLLNQDVSWYDQNQTGDFASRMSDDLYKFQEGIGEKVPMFVHTIVFFISAIIIALFIGWELALISLVSVPASIVSFVIINLLTTRLAKNEMEAYAAAGSIAEEVFSLVRTVTAFGGQQKEVQRYTSNLVIATKNNIKKSLLNGIGFGLLYLLLYGSYGLAFWYGVRLVLNDRNELNPSYTPGKMVTVFFSIMSASLSLGAASPFLETFAVAKAAAVKIFGIIESKPIINLSKNKGFKLDSFKGNIEFKNVNFTYPSRSDVPVLQGLNIKIKAGETVALVGSSGCGKSTVIQLLQRFYDATQGQVLIEDTNIKDLDLTWYRSKIGIVGQEPVLFDTTILENIKYGKEGVSDQEVIAAAKKANAHNFIKALPNGYNTTIGERGLQLSGGQKQRIAIARALIKNPTLMLLDEATSALDNTSEAQVQAALDLVSEDCTTIIVAHRLSTIRKANKIFVLSQGVVVEEGTHEELMELQNHYYRLVTNQITGTENDPSRKLSRISVASQYENDLVDESVEVNESDDFKTDKNISMFEIVKMNAPEWPYLLMASIGSGVVGCGLPIFAVIFGSILGVLADGDKDYIISKTNFYSLCFIVAGAICMVAVFLQNYCLGIAGEKMTERVRTQLFSAIISQEMAFFDKKANGVGALCAKLSGDAARIQGATGQRVGVILQNFATFGLGLGVSLYYEWRLGLVTAAIAPLIILAVYFERRNTAGLSNTGEKSLQKSTKIAVEAVGNIRTVAGLLLEDKLYNNYITELTPHYKSSVKLVHSRGIVYGLSRSLTFFAYAAIMYYGGHLVVNGMYYDKMFKIAQAQMMGVVSIANSLAFSPNLTTGLTAARKVKSFLKKLPAIRDNPDAKLLPQIVGNVSYKKIEFSYPTRAEAKILQGLNLNIISGKTVALVGESGCGKSTVIQLLERFYDPDSGCVELDGTDIKNVLLRSLRSHLGIVSQEPNLFNKTIAENIAYGDNLRVVPMDEIIQAAKDANIHNFIAGLPKGYDTKLGEKAVQLSGGQKQRIAIARALIRNPKILLLDEATSALDSESEKVVQNALDRAKMGRTCITIAHRLTTIKNADVICVIDKGIISESGTHTELLEKKGIYYKLYNQKTS